MGNMLCTQALLGRPDFKFVFDGLHGVAGPYAKRIFVQVRKAHSLGYHHAAMASLTRLQLDTISDRLDTVTTSHC